MNPIWIYIFVMAVTSYLLRVLPITLIRRQIKNRFIRSVFYYMPYVTLTVMTVPAIFAIAENTSFGVAALICAAATAFFTSNLFLSACAACGAVFLLSVLL